MRKVSEKWKENQRSRIKAQGYVDIEINFNSSILKISPGSADYSNLSEVRYTDECDPMAMSLPNRSIEIDLYDYDKAYFKYYKEYTDEKYSITAKNGYIFSGEKESVSGGRYTMSAISYSDNIITFHGECGLYFRDEQKEVFLSDIETVIYESGWTDNSEREEQTIKTSDLNWNGVLISFTNVLNDIGANDIISADDTFLNRGANFYIKPVESVKNFLQYMLNMKSDKGIISDDDLLEIKAYDDRPPSGEILQINNTDIYDISITNKVKNIEYIKGDKVPDTDKSEYKEWYYHKTDTGDLIINFNDIDYSKNIISELNFSHITASYLKKISFIYNSNGFISMRVYVKAYGSHDYKNINLTIAPLLEETAVYNSEQNKTGAVLDISNVLGVEPNTEKLNGYYLNRQVYTFHQIADPSTQAGDYIWISLEDDSDISAMRRAIILKKEMTFNGSFDEDLTVREIDTDFESNLHIDDGDNLIVSSSVLQKKSPWTSDNMINYINIPKSIDNNEAKSIGANTFDGCTGLDSVLIGSHINIIGDYAFRGCLSLKHLLMHPGIKSIGNYAFSGCNSLTSFELPEGVTALNSYTLSNCTELKKVVVHKDVTSINRYTFSGTKNIEEITLPYVGLVQGGTTYNTLNGTFGVNSYRETGFCDNLKKVRILDSCTILADSSFRNRKSIEEIVLPNTIESFGGYIFNGCSGLTRINNFNTETAETMSEWFSGCISLKFAPKLNTKNVKDFRAMFYNCKSLVSIPNYDFSSAKSTYIMFRLCENLKSLPEMNTHSVYNVNSMFARCKSLETIQSIDLSSVDDSVNMEDIFSGCTSLRNIVFKGTINVSIDFSDCLKLSHDSLMEIIHALNIVENQTLTLGEVNVRKLKEEEIKIAFDKGWNVVPGLNGETAVCGIAMCGLAVCGKE